MSSLKDAFCSVLKRWAEEATGNQVYAYQKALRSLENHEDDINNMEDLKKVKFIGKTLTRRLYSVYQERLNISTPNSAQHRTANPMDGWTIESWLQGISMSRYTDLFRANGFDEFHSALNLTMDELKDLGIELVGHRKAICNASQFLGDALNRFHQHDSIGTPHVDGGGALQFPRGGPSPPSIASTTSRLGRGTRSSASSTRPSTLGTPSTSRHAIGAADTSDLNECIGPSSSGVFSLFGGGDGSVDAIDVTGPLPSVSMAFIHQNTCDDAFARGLELSHGVAHMVASEDHVIAPVQDLDSRVLVNLSVDRGNVRKATCTCERDSAGWCAHVAAVLVRIASQANASTPYSTERLGSSTHSRASRRVGSSTHSRASRRVRPSTRHSPQRVTSSTPSSPNASPSRHVVSSPSSRKRRRLSTTPYVPKTRSGPWALLVALGTLPHSTWIGKDDLKRLAQNYCDSSFYRGDHSIPPSGHRSPNPKAWYTAWNSMQSLIKRDLVLKRAQSGPTTYSLSVKGRELAMALNNVDEIDKHHSRTPVIHTTRSNTCDITRSIDGGDASSPPSSMDTSAPIIAFDAPSPPHRGMDHHDGAVGQGSRECPITLVLDSREVSGRLRSRALDHQLRACGVAVQLRTLDVGDMLWVARVNGCAGDVVLDYIVERKRVDDFVASLKDGRFEEQKFRLRACGLSNVFYLVEGTVAGEEAEALERAMVATSVMDGFFVVQTPRESGTCAYLAELTHSIEDKYQTDEAVETRHRPTFSQFGKRMSKSGNLCLSDLFAKQLLQICRLSAPIAKAITRAYPSPAALLKAYGDAQNPQLLLQDIMVSTGTQTRRIGPAMSRNVYRAFYT